MLGLNVIECMARNRTLIQQMISVSDMRNVWYLRRSHVSVGLKASNYAFREDVKTF